jgi:2-dehydropantoate 2-reductase
MMNIIVFGLGSLGTVYAASLKAAGHTVYAVTKEKYMKSLHTRNVKISGIWGNREAVLDGIFSDVNALLETSIDLIILTVKSYDTAEAVKQIKKIVRENTLVIISQNGYGNYETVSDTVGKEHVLLARVIFGARLVETGHSEVTVIADDVKIGQPDKAVDEKRIIAVADAINSAGIPASYSQNVYSLLWDKILYNCALNPLGALLESTYGALAEYEGTRRIMNDIINEIFDVANAYGITLKWKTPEDYREHFYTKLVPPTKEHFPSMYYDLKIGKKIEIHALNGAIVRLAHKKNVSVPVNETITDLIQAKEAQSFLYKMGSALEY